MCYSGYAVRPPATARFETGARPSKGDRASLVIGLTVRLLGRIVIAAQAKANAEFQNAVVIQSSPHIAMRVVSGESPDEWCYSVRDVRERSFRSLGPSPGCQMAEIGDTPGEREEDRLARHRDQLACVKRGAAPSESQTQLGRFLVSVRPLSAHHPNPHNQQTKTSSLKIVPCKRPENPA